MDPTLIRKCIGAFGLALLAASAFMPKREEKAPTEAPEKKVAQRAKENLQNAVSPVTGEEVDVSEVDEVEKVIPSDDEVNSISSNE